MLRDGGGYRKGAVVEPREGIARTLVSIGAAEYVSDSVEPQKDKQPRRSASKSGGRKKAPAAKSE